MIYLLRFTPSILSATLPLLGCVSSPQRIDRNVETHAANDPAALLRIGDTAASTENWPIATSFYKRVFELEPDNADAALRYAHSLAAGGSDDEAIAALRAALGHMNQDSSPRIVVALGKVLVLAHHPTEAVAMFRQGLETNPQDPAELIGLGVALDASRDFLAAQKAYRQAIALEPESCAARNDLALSMALHGDSSLALSALRALHDQVAETGGPAINLATIDGNLALVYAMRGNLTEARETSAGAVPDRDDPAENMRFYGTLGPLSP